MTRAFAALALALAAALPVTSLPVTSLPVTARPAAAQEPKLSATVALTFSGPPMESFLADPGASYVGAWVKIPPDFDEGL